VIALVVVAFVMFESGTGELSIQFSAFPPELWASLVIIFVHVSFFAFKIRAVWVRLAADVYARQLLAACDALEDPRRA